MSGIMQRLREQTQAQHEALQATPFFAALHDQTLARDSYVAWLRVLHTLHETLEVELSRSSDPWVKAVWCDEERRTPWLERDLAHLAQDTRRDAPGAQLRAILMAQQMRHVALSDAPRLLGVLYVLEGSALGGQVLKKQLGARFGLREGAGLDYLSGRGADTQAHFRRFSERMDAHVNDVSVMRRVVDAARALFSDLEEVLRALHPLSDERLGDMVKALNPDAGTHGIADDLSEIAAALRAGELSWRAFPYYEARYGARGQRFTRSDSAWLVTLCRLEPPQVRRHVTWLGQVLAARGMPRLMLEEHLLRLHGLLCEALPERRERYEPLLAAHALLHEARVSQLSAAAQKALALEFDRGPAARVGLVRVGELLVSAVADELDGVDNAVSSLSGWLTERGRFDASFQRAVQTLLQATHRAFAAAG